MIAFIRAHTINDFESIAELAHEIWHEHYTPIIGKAQVTYMINKYQTSETMQKQADDGYEYYLINFSDTPVGYLAIQKREDQLFLSKIYILSSYRGKKIGKEAFKFIDNRAKSLQCTEVALTVNKNNSNTIKAYERIGYQKTEAIVIDIGNGFVMDDYKMVKPI